MELNAKKFRKIQVKSTLYNNMVCMCDIAYFYKTTMYLYVTCERVSLVPREDLDIYTRIYIIHSSYIYISKVLLYKIYICFYLQYLFHLFYIPESKKTHKHIQDTYTVHSRKYLCFMYLVY